MDTEIEIRRWHEAMEAASADARWCVLAFAFEAQRAVLELGAAMDEEELPTNETTAAIDAMWARAARRPLDLEFLPTLSHRVIVLPMLAPPPSEWSVAARELVTRVWTACMWLTLLDDTGPSAADMTDLVGATFEATADIGSTLMNPVLTGVIRYATARILSPSTQPWDSVVRAARADAASISAALHAAVTRNR